MGPVIAKSIAAATVVFLILQAQRHDNSSLAAAAATVPIGTVLSALVAFASADPSRAQTFARSAVLALPVWCAFAISTFLLTRVVDWRPAVGAGLLIWCGAALVYLRLSR